MLEIISNKKLQQLLEVKRFEKVHIISLKGVHESYVNTWPTQWQVLEVLCDDIEPNSTFSDLQLLSLGQAKDILDFAYDRIPLIQSNKSVLYVQCNGGVSRSPAVAAGISFCINNEDDWWVFNNSSFCPNRHIYETIIKASGKPASPGLIDAKFRKNEILYFTENPIDF